MKRNSIIFLILLIFILSSCRVFNPSLMLRMGTFPKYSSLDLIKQDNMYRIAIYDDISFSISSNDGEALISNGTSSVGSAVSGGGSGSTGGSYQVEFDGTVKFPIFGRTPVVGLTIRELEKLLEEKYSLFYNKPFVSNVNITNRKVFVFRGGNSSSVVNLPREKMTIWELIAQTGGVGDAKAHRIKLIRQIDNKFYFFLIDLSRLESINTGNIVLQANDIIYITPRNRFSSEIMNALTPYLSLFSTLVLIYTLVKK